MKIIRGEAILGHKKTQKMPQIHRPKSATWYCKTREGGQRPFSASEQKSSVLAWTGFPDSAQCTCAERGELYVEVVNSPT